MRTLLLTILISLLSEVIYGKEKKILQNGDKSPVFLFLDINGKKVSLKDFRGAYVLIDLWNTMCGPCKSQLPYLSKLEKKMKGKNIVFVSISSDRSKERWEKFVKNEKLGGIQLHNGGDRSYMQAFGYETVPRFILLDKKGRIIERAMPRPSNPEMEEILMRLMANTNKNRRSTYYVSIASILPRRSNP